MICSRPLNSGQENTLGELSAARLADGAAGRLSVVIPVGGPFAPRVPREGPKGFSGARGLAFRDAAIVAGRSGDLR